VLEPGCVVVCVSKNVSYVVGAVDQNASYVVGAVEMGICASGRGVCIVSAYI
jgi:hypothetical protein